MSNQPVHVLSLISLSEHQLQQIQAVSPRLIISQRKLDPQTSTEQLAHIFSPDIDVLFTNETPFPLDLTPRLRWVQVYSAGVNQLIDTPIWHSDIPITSANGVHAVQIGEYTLSMLLALSHHLPHAFRLQQEGRWIDPANRTRMMTTELRGHTLGILGYGAIGREVARMASSFGMRIIATRRPDRPAQFDGWTPEGTGDPDGSIPERYYDISELHEMLPHCDMLVLALPLSKDTHHIIGQAELERLPSHALLVNIGRGPLIDHNALVDALRAGTIAGIGTDVTEPEPLNPESPLWGMENVIITPHISGLSAFYNDRVVDLFCTNMRRYLNDEPLLNLVQRSLGY
jgi:phosphoglycerate dehydrogenase-like enzyme